MRKTTHGPMMAATSYASRLPDGRWLACIDAVSVSRTDEHRRQLTLDSTFASEQQAVDCAFERALALCSLPTPNSRHELPWH